MDRRKALQYAALLTGGTIATPIATSLLSGCKVEPKGADFIPQLFSDNQFNFLKAVCNAILPDGEIPGALQTGVPEFIDHVVDKVFDDKTKKEYLLSLDQLMQSWNTGEKKYTQKNEQDQYSLILEIEALIKKEKVEEKTEVQKAEWHTPLDSLTTDKNGQYILTALQQKRWMQHGYEQIKQQAITYWLNSEIIATNHLNYLPIPGKYEACIPLESVGGKAWSE